MAKTTNLGLEITTEEAELFSAWWKRQNGQGDGTEENPLSNAQIIDNFAGAIYGVGGAVTLLHSSWVDNTYQLVVTDLGDNDAIFFSPTSFADKSALETSNCLISSSGHIVTFNSQQTPTVDIQLNYFISRGKA